MNPIEGINVCRLNNGANRDLFQQTLACGVVHAVEEVLALVKSPGVKMESLTCKKVK